MRWAILFMLGGCFADDAHVGRDGDHCLDPADYDRYTGEIFEPKDGQTVPAMFETRARWNQPGIPDRYIRLFDEVTDYAIEGSGHQVLGDGSETENYALDPGMELTFEIGWYCDDGNDFTDVVLDRVHFFTEP